MPHTSSWGTAPPSHTFHLACQLGAGQVVPGARTSVWEVRLLKLWSIKGYRPSASDGHSQWVQCRDDRK